MNSMSSLPSFGLGAKREAGCPSSEGVSAVVGECRETLAILDRYSALLLDDGESGCMTPNERAILGDMEARVKTPSLLRCQTLLDVYAKSAVYHELADWFPPHDLQLYASDLLRELSALLERDHLPDGVIETLAKGRSSRSPGSAI